jgi:uncharacterized membrane protein
MKKLRTTILLAALVGIVFSSSVSTVLCQGDDGHKAIETSLHNHCPSHAEHGENDGEHGHGRSLAQTHNHCSDTVLTTNLVVSEQKTVSKTKLTVANNISQKMSDSSANAASKINNCWNIESTSFFTPLRTIVLLS